MKNNNEELTIEQLKPTIDKMNKLPWWYKIAPNTCQGTSWFLGRFLLDFFTNLKIKGRENLKEAKRLKHLQNSGVIFVANHISELDPMLCVSGIFPWTDLFPMFYVSRPMNLYKSKQYGWKRFFYGPTLFYLWGAHPLIKGTKNYKISLTRHFRLMEKKVSLCIFPQGGVKEESKTGIDEAKGGVGYLALHTGAVVVPVAISGSDRVNVKNFFSKKNHITVKYGKPITYDELLKYEQECKDSDNKYKCVSNKIADKVRELLKEINN